MHDDILDMTRQRGSTERSWKNQRCVLGVDQLLLLAGSMPVGAILTFISGAAVDCNQLRSNFDSGISSSVRVGRVDRGSPRSATCRLASLRHRGVSSHLAKTGYPHPGLVYLHHLIHCLCLLFIRPTQNQRCRLFGQWLWLSQIMTTSATYTVPDSVPGGTPAIMTLVQSSALSSASSSLLLLPIF
ncbi:hypothetical protein BDV12DRAFT_164618 [Aspergillus spectabilis]